MTNESESIRVSLTPGTETPEGAKRFNEAVETRNDIDYRAYMLLRRLRDEFILTEAGLRVALRNLGEGEDVLKAEAKQIAEEVEQIIRERRDADEEVVKAATGRVE